MVCGPRDENVLSTGVRSPIRPCNVNLRRRIPRPIDICPYTPIVQGLVEDIDAMHAYGRNSPPIGQGLVYDINAPHPFGLRESKRTYGPVSTPIVQGLVVIINAKDEKL